MMKIVIAAMILMGWLLMGRTLTSPRIAATMNAHRQPWSTALRSSPVVMKVVARKTLILKRWVTCNASACHAQKKTLYAQGHSSGSRFGVTASWTRPCCTLTYRKMTQHS
jgi:hypothetical protein